MPNVLHQAPWAYLYYHPTATGLLGIQFTRSGEAHLNLLPPSQNAHCVDISSLAPVWGTVLSSTDRLPFCCSTACILCLKWSTSKEVWLGD